MKKIFVLTAAAAVVLCSGAHAQKVSYMDEVKALGYVAGQGMACGASKFQTFEMLARAILITKAPNNKAQASAMYAYNNAKADAYFAKQSDGFSGCDDINRRFDSQPIYEATLYADGSIKMPDGKLFTPRKPYDATLLYKDRNDRTTAQKIYDRGKKIKTGDITIKTDTSTQTVPVVHSGADNQPQAVPTAAVPAENLGYRTPASAPSTPQDFGIGHIKRQ